ncbi:MAG: hypothetical protein IPN13_07250 [Bacteroidetes bacterium]|nr:hypothetical protein [Bacteroidota bacterium]
MLPRLSQQKLNEDNRLDNYYSETLYRARDGSFVLQCFGNANSKHAKVEGAEHFKNLFYSEVDPVQWLMEHNQQRLAGMLFPNMRNQVEKKLHDLKLQSELLKEDEFYQFHFDNRQTKSQLNSICNEANAMLGHEKLFVVEAEIDGITMLPGYEDYNDNKWDFLEKVQGNSFTGDFEITFEVEMVSVPHQGVLHFS